MHGSELALGRYHPQIQEEFKPVGRFARLLEGDGVFGKPVAPCERVASFGEIRAYGSPASQKLCGENRLLAFPQFAGELYHRERERPRLGLQRLCPQTAHDYCNASTIRTSSARMRSVSSVSLCATAYASKPSSFWISSNCLARCSMFIAHFTFAPSLRAAAINFVPVTAPFS